MNNRFEIIDRFDDKIVFDYPAGSGWGEAEIHASHSDKFEVEGEEIVIRPDFVEDACNCEFENATGIEEPEEEITFERNLTRLEIAAGYSKCGSCGATPAQIKHLARLYTDNNELAEIDVPMTKNEASNQIDLFTGNVSF